MATRTKKIICKECKTESRSHGRGLCANCYARWRRRQTREVCKECGLEKIIYRDEKCARCARSIGKTERERKAHHAQEERERRKKFPDRIRALDRKRNQTKKRKEWKRQYQRKYYLENKEWLLEYQREYRKDTQRQTVYKARRRNRVKNLESSLTPEQWQQILEEHNHSCFYCGATGCDLEMEHKTPASRGGGLTADNIAPSCGTCNRRKDIKTVQEYHDYLVSLGEIPLFTP